MQPRAAVNKHEFEHVAQILLSKIQDKQESLFIGTIGTNKMREVSMHRMGHGENYLGSYDSAGNEQPPITPHRSPWAGTCPLTSDEIKSCLKLLDKLAPDASVTAYSGKAQFTRYLKPLDQMVFQPINSMLTINVDRTGIVKAQLR
jgi:hypothetical protein